MKCLNAAVFPVILALIFFAGCAEMSEVADKLETEHRAIAEIHPVGDSRIYGLATFTEGEYGVKVSIEMRGLTPGLHGLHLHQYGAFAALDSNRARIIYDPFDKPHAGPDHMERQLGDWGNIAANEEGYAKKEWIDIDLTLSGVYNLIGRGVVVHAGEDDMITEPAGGSGTVVAAGTIGIMMSTE